MGLTGCPLAIVDLHGDTCLYKALWGGGNAALLPDIPDSCLLSHDNSHPLAWVLLGALGRKIHVQALFHTKVWMANLPEILAFYEKFVSLNLGVPTSAPSHMGIENLLLGGWGCFPVHGSGSPPTNPNSCSRRGDQRQPQALLGLHRALSVGGRQKGRWSVCPR